MVQSSWLRLECLPDHKLVIATTIDVVGIRCGEDIVGNISSKTGSVITPINGGWQALHFANQVAFG